MTIGACTNNHSKSLLRHQNMIVLTPFRRKKSNTIPLREIYELHLLTKILTARKLNPMLQGYCSSRAKKIRA